MAVEDQIMSIFAGNQGYLDNIPISAVLRFREELLQYLRASHPEIGTAILAERKLSDQITAQLTEAISAFGVQFAAEG
jgi:F-type H+-transporting ATPase subunit alpha